jgi:hypothetical protein
MIKRKLQHYQNQSVKERLARFNVNLYERQRWVRYLSRFLIGWLLMTGDTV